MMHTPGPWEITESTGHAIDCEPRFVVYSDDYPDNRVAVISLRGSPNGDRFLHEANARLVAASPLMFEALTEIMDMINDDDVTAMFPAALRDKGNAAIAQAKADE